MRIISTFIAILIVFLCVVTSFSQNVRRTEELVKFPQNGNVKVEIVERIDKPTVINFWKDKTKVKLATFTLRNGDRYIPFQFESAVNPLTKIRVLEKIEGLPVPLIQVVSINPGGSDHGFWTNLIGEVNGKIKILTKQKIENSIQGGVYFGDLGKGNGVGLALFNYIWGKDEAHYQEHRYRVDLYKFNQVTGMFVKTKSFVSKHKHESEFAALKELGFAHFTNRLNDFPNIEDYRETENNNGEN